MKKALVLVPFVVALFALSAIADDTLVKFRGGIGVLPVASAVGLAATAEVVNRNIVRGVQPAGQIWVISAPVAGRRRSNWLQRQRQRLRDADL